MIDTNPRDPDETTRDPAEPPKLALLLVLAAGAAPGYLVNGVIGAVLGGMALATLFLMVWERNVVAFAWTFTLLGLGVLASSLWYIVRSLAGP